MRHVLSWANKVFIIIAVDLDFTSNVLDNSFLMSEINI